MEKKELQQSKKRPAKIFQRDCKKFDMGWLRLVDSLKT